MTDPLHRRKVKL